MNDQYAQFLAGKAQAASACGIEPSAMPDHMFDYQKSCTEFCIRQGRAALFLDTGLGKTICELEFAKQSAAATNGFALILTPLAVAHQIEREAHRFGYEARVIREQSDLQPGINICNYDRLDKLDASAFGCVVLDESSILKSFTGSTSRALISTFSATPFRLCATATPAPNDHTELGTHAEFLGIMNQADMLARWFINDTQDTGNWRLKGHAWRDFWDWMTSWARMAETPADLGYDGSRFILPPLRVHKHKAIGDVRPSLDGLFAADVSATNMFAIKRETADARADVVAGLVAGNEDAWVIWCDTDAEADALNKRLPVGFTEVRGSHTADMKEARLASFAGGTSRGIITKSRIAGFGLNWQHCCKMVFVGRSFSYEAWYQAVRRCYRFGQTHPVDVHIIVAEGEDQIGRVIDRKADGHTAMKRAMADAMKRDRAKHHEQRVAYTPTHKGRLPIWLVSAA